MLDSDLAELYGVPTGRLNEQVKRNIKRFPEHFMLQLTQDEYDALRSQIAILKTGGRGRHRKYLPRVFTEQGVAMLSSVLQSERAVQMNILIVRAFVKLREMLATHKDLAERMEKIEAAQESGDAGSQRRIAPIAEKLITAPIRYSSPGLRDHITYLRGMTARADMKIGRDAIARHDVLRSELDEITREVNAILGSGN